MKMKTFELHAWHFVLEYSSLSKNGITEERVCVLVEALQVNQMDQMLKLK